MTNVYTSYLQTAKPGNNNHNKIHVKFKQPGGLNSDLEDLSGFGLVNAHASKSNCFSSHRDEFGQIKVSAEVAAMQNTGYTEAFL